MSEEFRRLVGAPPQAKAANHHWDAERILLRQLIGLAP